MHVFQNVEMKIRLSACAATLLFACQIAAAGTLRDRLLERREAQRNELSADDESGVRARLPAGVRLTRDIAYGDDAKQRMDVYAPQHAANAPVIFMVHGGAWRFGDKAARAVVDNKVARWLSKGFIFVTVNYRMLPDRSPLQQAEDVALALGKAQGMATSWGGDASKFILIGHSAGAHIVSLLAASPALVQRLGARPWLGTISLDSAALDVVEIMERKHMRLYDPAFGSDPANWRAASPFHQLTVASTPFLAVCSSLRKDSCPPASAFVAKDNALGAHAQTLAQPLSHGDINKQLGEAGSYTDAVEVFMGGLDAGVMKMFAR